MFRKFVRLLLFLFVLLVMIFYLFIPLGVGIWAANAPQTEVGSIPHGFETVILNTEDGDQLAAWYTPPQNGAAILLIHGAGGSRNSVRSYATMLVKNGYGVLSIDLRGHGKSGGQTNLFGWEGNRDVGAAVTFLQTQPDVKTIGGLGVSLGGEVLLGAASAHPAIRAIVSDGATLRCYEEYQAVPEAETILADIETWMMYFFVGVFTGDEPPTPILESVRDADSHFLLIVAGNVEREKLYNTRFVEAADGRAELWVAPEVGHTNAFGHYPDEYKQRVIGFFDDYLLTS